MSEPATAQVDEQGRVRAVPHVVGNFATHIYFRVPLERKELTALLELPSKAFGKGVWKEIDGEPHVSLSRTVFLRAYELEPFVARLRAEVGALKLGTFDASFSSWRVFGNDTGTRWFASLVQAGGVEESKALIGAADRALEAFAQPVYYEVGYFAGSVGPFPRGVRAPFLGMRASPVLSPPRAGPCSSCKLRLECRARGRGGCFSESGSSCGVGDARGLARLRHRQGDARGSAVCVIATQCDRIHVQAARMARGGGCRLRAPVDVFLAALGGYSPAHAE